MSALPKKLEHLTLTHDTRKSALEKRYAGTISNMTLQPLWRNKNGGGPEPRAPPADDEIVNPGQSFLGKFAGKRRKEAFFGQ